MEKGTAHKKVASLLPKPNNVMTVPTSSNMDFFKWWCVFLKPFVHLTNREIDIVSSFLRQRWELSNYISDPTILDKMLMDESTKEKVSKECNITIQNLCVVISSLKKRNIIVNNTLNPRLIPNIRKDDNGIFQLLVLFKDSKS